MADRTVHGVVLRYANYSESSRMLTLLTAQEGIVSAAARGARRMKSPLRTASEVFAFGEYVLHSGRGSDSTLTGASLIESFYELREDLDRLACASGMGELVLALAPEGEPAPELFSLLVRSLSSLCHDGEDPFKVGMHFQTHAMALAGYGAQVDRCTVCGGALGLEPGFSPSDGGAVCTGCAQAAGLEPVSPGVIRTLGHVMEFDVARLHVLAIHPRMAEQLRQLWQGFMAYHISRHLRSAEFSRRVERFNLALNEKK